MFLVAATLLPLPEVTGLEGVDGIHDAAVTCAGLKIIYALVVFHRIVAEHAHGDQAPRLQASQLAQ